MMKERKELTTHRYSELKETYLVEPDESSQRQKKTLFLAESYLNIRNRRQPSEFSILEYFLMEHKTFLYESKIHVICISIPRMIIVILINKLRIHLTHIT